MAAFLDYYALSFNPFDKQCIKEKDGFMSSDFKQMTSRKSLVPNKDHMEYICLSTVSVAEFYRELCEILGVSLRGGKPGRFKAIQEQIEYLYREKRQPLILAVDEAQFLNTAILNDIRMLMNYGYDSLNCFTLILCGESHLNSTLKPVHEALRQRITVHYDFTGLSDTEVPEYVRHKISIAGGAPSIITEAAMASVNSLSQGNPRIIDNIMTDALTIGAQKDRSVIDPEVILSAVNNQNLG